MGLSNDLLDQRKREELGAADGAARYARTVEDAVSRQREDSTGYGLAVVRSAITSVAEAITKLDVGMQERIQGLSPEALAYIGLREAVSSMSFGRRTWVIAHAIGRDIEREQFARAFRSQHEAAWTKMMWEVEQERGGEGTKWAKFRRIASNTDFVWQAWSKPERVKIGGGIMLLIVDKTGMFRIYRDVRAHGKTLQAFFYLVPTDEAAVWIANWNAFQSCIRPMLRPTIVPPKDWESETDGGYWFTPNSIIRTHLASVAGHPVAKPVLECVSAVQAIPWSINQRVLDVLRVMATWTKCKALPEAVRPEFYPRPPENDVQALRQWKSDARRTFVERRIWTGRRMGLDLMLADAADIGTRDFWTPWGIDFRGRMYPFPTWLQPQGPDWTRSLFLFSQGIPMGPTGAKWLMIHLANLWGEGKKPYTERAKWTIDNKDRILAAAASPLDNEWWQKADEPWKFLAAAFEFESWLKHGDSYITRLPIAVDGTCNGIQHYAALTRDEACAKSVNLVPSDSPRDIYADVATVVRDALEGMRYSEDYIEVKGKKFHICDLARKWLLWGVDRKICKRPVMIMPYGGTIHSMRAYALTTYREGTRAGREELFAGEESIATRLLGELIHRGLRERLGGPAAAMDWLRGIAAAYSKRGLMVSWTTPDGLKVEQEYRKTKDIRVRVSWVKNRRITVKTDGGLPDAKAARQGFPPNLIHSLDATHCRRVVSACHRQGIMDLLLVHDSYATHAPNMDALQSVIRDEFVSMHSAPILRDIQRQLSTEWLMIASPPDLGWTGVEGVRKSPYFFA